MLDLIFSLEDKSPFLGEGRHSHHPVYKLYSLFKNNGNVTSKKIDGYSNAAKKAYEDDPELKEFYNLINKPWQDLLSEYFLGTEASFNQQLLESLNKDKEYFDTTEDNRFRDVMGWLPWTLISLASKAYDKGWEITVEDPRLPMFLVKGECKVESLAP